MGFNENLDYRNLPNSSPKLPKTKAKSKKFSLAKSFSDTFFHIFLPNTKKLGSKSNKSRRFSPSLFFYFSTANQMAKPRRLSATRPKSTRSTSFVTGFLFLNKSKWVHFCLTKEATPTNIVHWINDFCFA